MTTARENEKPYMPYANSPPPRHQARPVPGCLAFADGLAESMPARRAASAPSLRARPLDSLADDGARTTVLTMIASAAASCALAVRIPIASRPCPKQQGDNVISGALFPPQFNRAGPDLFYI